MRNKFFFVVLTMVLVSGPLFSQDHFANLDKYWTYRHKLVNDFMVIGDQQGMSLPAERRDTAAKELRWGDATVRMGWYIGTLALEYHMLTHPHKYPNFEQGNVNAISQTLDELYYALRTVNRLDANAESSFPPCDSLADVVNGFFLRDDVPADFHTNFAGINNSYSDFTGPVVYDKEMSQDQAYHLMMGLAMVKAFIPAQVAVNGMQLQQAAITQAMLIGNWINQDGWKIKNPVCPDTMAPKNVARGADASLLSFGLNEMIKFITDGAVNYDNDIIPFYTAIWNSLISPTNPGYSNPDNLHMTMLIAAVGNGWEDNTLPTLMDLAVKYKWYAYPLIFSALYKNTFIPGFSGLRDTMNYWAEDMLNEAPDNGPYDNFPDSSTGYAVNNRFLHVRSRHYTGEPTTAGSQFPGLDYMLLHNLYYIVSPSKWPVTYEWAPIGATWHYDQIELGTADQEYHKFESVGDTTINGVNAKIIDRHSERYSSQGNSVIEDSLFMFLDSNKVYYYWDNNFRLLYDFNAEPGDTFLSYCPNEGYSYVVVDSISEININGNILKVWHVISPPTAICYMNGQLIERIGWLEFMFPQSVVADPPWGGPLRCYEDSLVGFYNPSGEACDFIATSVETPPEKNTVELFPNPANDILFLQIANNKNRILRISIYNAVGQLIEARNYNNAQRVEIDIHQYQKGIYFLQIMDDNGSHHVKRFIKDQL